MKNLTNTTTIEIPFVEDQGWCKVYATPIQAAWAHEPCCTFSRSFSLITERMEIIEYHGRKGTFAVRPWYQIVPFQDEPAMIGWIRDEWADEYLA